MPDTGAPWNIPYVESTDLVSGWPADSLALANAIDAGLDAAGGLVAVKTVLKTDTFSASLGNAGNTTITGLTITHALADASNKLFLTASVGTLATAHGRGQVGIAFYDGTSLIGIGDADGSRTRVAAGGHISATAENLTTSMPSIQLLHSPGDTSSRTYEVRVIHITDVGSATVYVNRPVDARDITAVQRASASFTLMEVSV